IGGCNQISFQIVVHRAVQIVWAGCEGKGRERLQKGSLRLSKEKLAEVLKIDLADIRVKRTSSVQAPAHPEWRALLFVLGQSLNRLTEGLQAVEGIEGGKLLGRQLNIRNPLSRIQYLRFQVLVLNERNYETNDEDEQEPYRRGQQHPSP